MTSVAVDNAGVGYTAPTVTFSGGGATTDATGHVLGGVDAVNLSVDGAGYSFPTVDFDLPDDPNWRSGSGPCTRVRPRTLTATWAPTRLFLAVTGVVVDNAGSGYTSAPNVVVRDGTLFDPINPPAHLRRGDRRQRP